MKTCLETQWTCPKCNSENLDDFGDSVLLLCENCEQDFLWEDVLSDEQFEELIQLS